MHGLNAWWRHQMETLPPYWPFVRGIHRSRMDSPHKGQWRGALILNLFAPEQRVEKKLDTPVIWVPSRSSWRQSNVRAACMLCKAHVLYRFQYNHAWFSIHKTIDMRLKDVLPWHLLNYIKSAKKNTVKSLISWFSEATRRAHLQR